MPPSGWQHLFIGYVIMQCVRTLFAVVRADEN